EIAEARFENASGVDGVDVEKPIDGDERRGKRVGCDAGVRRERPPVLGPSVGEAHQNGEKDGRPDDAMRQYFERRHLLERLEVNRKYAPADISSEGSAEARAFRPA